MLDKLFGGTEDVMAKAMGGLSARQKAIGENVANVDTPHYKRLEVAFERQLAEAAGHLGDDGNVTLAATQAGHFRIDGPQSLDEFQVLQHRSSESTLRNDGNNVDIDAEMTRLAQTSQTYNALADLMKRNMSELRTVIRG